MGIAYVQSAIASNTTSGGISVGLGTVSAGDLIVAGVATGIGSGTTVTVQDGLSNSYVQIGSYLAQGTMVVSLWYTIAVNGGSCTLTATASSGAGKMGLGCASYTGAVAPTASALDGASIGNAGIGTPANTNSVPVSASGDVVVGWFAQTANGVGFTGGTGTVRQNLGPTPSRLGVAFVDLLNQSSAVTPSGTYSSGGAWAALGASFFAAPPAGLEEEGLFHTFVYRW